MPAPDPTDDAPDLPPGTVLVARSGGYLVASESTPGAWWLVYGRSCSCPAGRNGHASCRHRAAVARHVADEEARHRRPQATPHVSALVD